MAGLRSFNIGTRLGAGFAAILLTTGGLLAAVIVGAGAQMERMQQAQHAADARISDATALQVARLGQAVAVRSMGLQSEVDAVNRDAGLARKQQTVYAETRQRLDAADLGDDDRAILKRLDELDVQMGAMFKEAVDLLGTFNGEQASALITGKIDPLLVKATGELDAFVALQKQRGEQAAAEGIAAARRVGMLAVGAALAIILASAVFSWRLTLSIVGPMREAESAARRMADGDLSLDVDVQGDDEAARMLAAIRAMRERLAEVVAQVRHNSETVASASGEIAQGNGDLSVRTERQASALQQTSSSMEELGTTVRHNADVAREASALAQSATAVAVRGGEVVGKVVTTMRGIQESSQRIAHIIGTIDGIAFQTNILALNASVEAARASEQGRGFAVVAGEVRNLAQRSAEAAREIKALIAESVERIGEGTELVDVAGTTMTDVVESIRRVNGLMSEISNASAEQSAGISQVSEAISHMDQTTQQNAALVEESAAAAESLREQAGQLVAAVSVFRLEAGGRR